MGGAQGVAFRLPAPAVRECVAPHESEPGGLLNFHLHSPLQVLLFKHFFSRFCVSKVFLSL
jgi:hypothetical protein